MNSSEQTLSERAKALGKLTCTHSNLTDPWSPSHIRQCTMHAILFGQSIGAHSTLSEREGLRTALTDLLAYLDSMPDDAQPDFDRVGVTESIERAEAALNA